MKPTILPLVALCGLLFAAERSPADAPGIPPKASRAEYDVTGFTESLAVGASLLNPSQVRMLFGNNLDGKYVVVEVGFYSKNRSSYPVRHTDFALQPPKSQTRVSPEPPSAVAKRIGQAAAPLSARVLPEVSTSRAVAGYLFFPAGSLSSSALELDYRGNGTWLTLPLR